MSHDESPVKKALFVRLRAKTGKEADVEAFLRDGLSAVMEEHDTTTWFAVRFGHDDFAILDTFPGDAGRLAHLAGKVGRALIAKTPVLLDEMPKIEHAQVLAYKLPTENGQIDD
jgi:hypothetical protein